MDKTGITRRTFLQNSALVALAGTGTEFFSEDSMAESRQTKIPGGGAFFFPEDPEFAEFSANSPLTRW